MTDQVQTRRNWQILVVIDDNMVVGKYIDMNVDGQMLELYEVHLEEPWSSMYILRETLAIFDKKIIGKAEDRTGKDT